MIRQFYLGCLAHASYLVADEASGVAAVVDPQRDVEQYLEAAAAAGARIRYVFLTHFHADFLAGHLELRERCGAEICLGSRAKAEYAFRGFEDGEELRLGGEGSTRLRVLHTPGHTPESITLLVYEPGETRPRAALTGDTLFVGDVGRPDLRAALGWSAQDLGRLLHASLREKLLPLPDETLVYPAHGAGSLCGKNIAKELATTMGAQRRDNYALQPMTEAEFLEIVLAGQPEAPAYFTYDAVLNTRERANLEASLASGLRPLKLEHAIEAERRGARVLDVRPPQEFAEAHWRGAVNIPLDGSFATWCGTMLDPGGEIVIVAEPEREREAGIRLGRIGFDRIAGYLAGGIAGLEARPELVEAHARLSAAAAQGRWLLDVRTEREREAGHVPGSAHIPLAQLAARRAEVPLDRPVAVYCQSGYRSAIAASLIQAWGGDVAEVEGGFHSFVQNAVENPPVGRGEAR